MEHLPSTIVFSDSANYSLSVVGEKGIDLGRMISSKLPIPPGFVIPSYVFTSLLTEDIKKQLEIQFSRIEEKHPETIKQVSSQLQQIILKIEIPEDIARAIADAYRKLGTQTYVAIRGSQTDARLPHVHATFLNLQGDANVIHAVKQAWAEIFSPKPLLSMFENLIPFSQVTQALVVQQMSQSRVSGVMYTKNPENNNKRNIIIDAIWGLGEYLNDHLIQADRYEIEKDTWELVQQNRHAQDKELVRKGEGTQEVATPEVRKFAPKLTSEELKQLAQLAIKVQQFLFFPQRIEWSLEENQIFILQTEQLVEQITDPQVSVTQQTGTMRPILFGSSVSPGLISGKARICIHDQDYSKVQAGEILVIKKLSMLQLEKIRKVAAIVADDTIFPRDVHSLGIPCVGNTKFGTHIIKNGQAITVFGQQGTVYDGQLEYKMFSNEEKKSAPHTKVYLSTGEPESLNRSLLDQVAGIGLLRAEYMVADLDLHPKHALHTKKDHLFTHRLQQGIKKACEAVHPRPVYYRFLDMTSSQMRKLAGGEEYEPKEENPIIGYRGALRFLTDLSSFNLEVDAIKELKREGYDNLHIMLPFVRSVEEFVLLQSHLRSHGLAQSKNLQLWLMVETPAVALSIESFLSHGVDGIAIGSQDLKMLLLGLDPQVASVFSHSYDHSSAFLNMLKNIAESAAKFKKPVIYCEQTMTKDLVEYLSTLNLEGISVNARQIPFVEKILKEKQHL